MPAKSKSQQRLFGMVDAYQKGELDNASKEVKDIAKGISHKDARDFAKTKHKGLPNRVKSTKNEGKVHYSINYQDLKEMVLNGVKMALKENDEGNYYGGGLPDRYFDEEPPQTYNEDEPENGEHVYIVFNKNEEIVCVCKSKETAMIKSEEGGNYCYFSKYRILE